MNRKYLVLLFVFMCIQKLESCGGEVAKIWGNVLDRVLPDYETEEYKKSIVPELEHQVWLADTLLRQRHPPCIKSFLLQDLYYFLHTGRV